MTVVCVRRWRQLSAGPWTVSCLQFAAAGYRVTAALGGGDGVRSAEEREPRCMQVQGRKARVDRRPMRRGLCSSVTSLHYNSRRMSSVEGQKFYFDTHAVVRHLEECGFSSKQSEVVVTTLLRVMNSNMEITYKDMATKNQQEIMLQQIMSHIAAVKKDMIILEKSEFSALRAANEKLKIELQQLKKQLTDEVVKVSSNNKLDLNLEKGRVQEMLTEHEKRVLETKADIVEVVQFSHASP
ncbi:mitochondrial calcium uniporter regulator 1 isoform X2 [Mobula birostris]|uniref:mitochondrial calcium uniporter regulator 1 isoform X2 n=1 Tax=Mobula birostris TaxID=1983395 RepID=UPI003B28846B